MRQKPDDPDIIHINPDAPPGGCGTYEEPYSTIEEGLERVRPGQTILLSAGEYVGDLNIQVSGTVRYPIRIDARPGARVVIRNGCWFFYDTSDIIVCGLTFLDAPHGAISVIGACSRNRFDSIRFINCGTREGASCTLYFGGAGGGCNIVENCVFEHAPLRSAEEMTVDNASVGLMVAQGDIEGGNPIVKTLLRRNRFVNYSYGIILGGDESKNIRCGHIVEYNTLVNCSGDGILIKSGDTLVRGNIIEKSCSSALSLQSELDCTIEENRIVDCRRGIVAQGRGHTIAGNCLIRCTGGAMWVGGTSRLEGSAASNCFIERNTFVDCGSGSVTEECAVAGILIGSGASGIVENNLIFGKGSPYAVVENIKSDGEFEDTATSSRNVTQFVIRDNGAAGGCSLLEGVGPIGVEFADPAMDDYSNGCGSGASGWVLRPEGFDPEIDEADDDGEYREASILEDESGNPIIPDEKEGGYGNLFMDLFTQQYEENEDIEDEEKRIFPR